MALLRVKAVDQKSTALIKNKKSLFCSLDKHKKCNILLNIENEIKADVSVASKPQQKLRVRRWLLMVNFLLFLIIGFMFSIAINVALLCIIYIMWTDN